MIAWLDGRVVARGPDHVVIAAGGVGYKVFVPRQPDGDAVRLYTHHVVREDAQLLFGFASRDELALFEMLVSVSQVGPKAALSLLAFSGPAELAAAIASGDVAALSKAPGVGKRTAERLIVELRSKVRGVSTTAAPPPAVEDDAVSALVALGYTAAEATRALASVAPGSAAERVLSALRGMTHAGGVA